MDGGLGDERQGAQRNHLGTDGADTFVGGIRSRHGLTIINREDILTISIDGAAKRWLINEQDKVGLDVKMSPAAKQQRPVHRQRSDPGARSDHRRAAGRSDYRPAILGGRNVLIGGGGNEPAQWLCRNDTMDGGTGG